VCCRTTLRKFEVIILANLTLYDFASRQRLLSFHRMWPPNSPDLNPGLSTWGIIQQQVYQSRMHNIDDWNNVCCVFGMALTRPSLAMQLISGVGGLRACKQAKAGRTLRATIVTIFRYMTFKFLSTVTRLWFICKLPQIRTSNFCKVVRQHTKGIVGSILWVLLKV